MMNANEALNRTAGTSCDCHERLGPPPVMRDVIIKKELTKGDICVHNGAHRWRV